LNEAEPTQAFRSQSACSTKWHLDRYDRLRASTASRAAVLLSAAAILSTSSVLILIGASGSSVPKPWLVCFCVGLVACALLVILTLINAAGVLVTRRSSRSVFAQAGTPPLSFVFNASDTVAHWSTYDDFASNFTSTSEESMLTAAMVELWIVIQQHRLRYSRLRAAVRFFQYAAATFVTLLAVVVTVVVVTHQQLAA
jgi:hypothetical protein